MLNELELVHSDIMGCTKCELHKSRTRAVPGEGPHDARIMFVGEGPGQNEDEQGRPFVGAAGKFLTELLESIGLKRTDVFITNIVKCRPPNNRAPRKYEIEACNPYLQSQIRLINPRIVCALGTPAITTLMGDEYSASRHHGKPSTKGEVVSRPSIEDQLRRNKREAGARCAGRSSIRGPRSRLRSNVHIYRVRVKDVVVSISRELLLANLRDPITRKWGVRVYP